MLCTVCRVDVELALSDSVRGWDVLSTVGGLSRMNLVAKWLVFRDEHRGMGRVNVADGEDGALQRPI